MTKNKLSTPAWVLEGFDSKEEYEKKKQKVKPLASSSESQTKGIKNKKSKNEKTFRIKVCPKCGSDEVGVVLTGEMEEIPFDSSEESQVKEGKGMKEWECRKCNWIGKDIEEKELNEDEFMKFLDEKGVEVA